MHCAILCVHTSFEDILVVVFKRKIEGEKYNLDKLPKIRRVQQRTNPCFGAKTNIRARTEFGQL